MGAGVDRTTNGVEVDQQSVASDGGGTPQLARRRLYVSVPVKFVVAQVLAAGWLGVSVWLSLPWVRELAATITIAPAVLVVCLIAYLPGWLVAFLAVSLLLDRQPPLRRTQPAVPVTVLIAARNEAERIQETISYIARQDYQGPIEVLVVDNGSADGTWAVAEAYGAATGQPVRCISEPRPGKSHALNTGLAAVGTELVITLDADTLLHARAVSQLVARLLNAPPDVQAVAGSVLVRNSRDSLWTRMQEWDYFLGIASVKRMQGLYQGTLVAQGAFSLYRTQAVLEAGGWPDAIGEDIALTWQLMRNGARVYYEPSAVAFTAAPTRLVHLARQRGPLGPGHDRGPPQRQALEPAPRAAALPHRHRPAHPGPGRRLRARLATRPVAGGDRPLLDRRPLHPGRAAAHSGRQRHPVPLPATPGVQPARSPGPT
jgi:poly-beta-1,6-N-acetyl-D-glucosamine synthase